MYTINCYRNNLISLPFLCWLLHFSTSLHTNGSKRVLFGGWSNSSYKRLIKNCKKWKLIDSGTIQKGFLSAKWILNLLICWIRAAKRAKLTGPLKNQQHKFTILFTNNYIPFPPTQGWAEALWKNVIYLIMSLKNSM